MQPSRRLGGADRQNLQVFDKARVDIPALVIPEPRFVGIRHCR